MQTTAIKTVPRLKQKKNALNKNMKMCVQKPTVGPTSYKLLKVKPNCMSLSIYKYGFMQSNKRCLKEKKKTSGLLVQ